MKANMALVNLQSPWKEEVTPCGRWMPEKYFCSKAVHVLLPSQSQTAVKVVQAAVKRASRTVEYVKNRGPPKKMGRKVSPVYTVQTQATARAALALSGTRTSTLVKSLMMAAAKPMMGIEIRAWSIRRARRKSRRKASSIAFKKSIVSCFELHSLELRCFTKNEQSLCFLFPSTLISTSLFITSMAVYSRP